MNRDVERMGRRIVAASFAFSILFLLGFAASVRAAGLNVQVQNVGSFTTNNSSTPASVASVELTTEGDTRVSIEWYGGCISGYSSSGGFQEVWAYIDEGAATGAYVLIKAGNQYWNCSFTYITDTLSAGSHTFSVRHAANGGGNHAVLAGSRLAAWEMAGGGGETGSTFDGEIVAFTGEAGAMVESILFALVTVLFLVAVVGAGLLITSGLRR